MVSHATAPKRMEEALSEIKAVQRSAGRGYDLVGNEPFQVFDHAIEAADRAGDRDGALKAMATLVDPALGATNWAGDALRRLLASASRVTSPIRKE